nr:carboxymuconolactone decarboxylase family protein [uncultured Caproiciproducens sp.]
MTNQNPFAVLKEEAPDVAEAFDKLIGAISSSGGLDAKTRQLIYIGIKASQGDAEAVAAHVPMAKMAGASRDEIRDTILMTMTVSGVLGVTHCLIPALEAYENDKKV